jgi:hypothetical protein
MLYHHKDKTPFTHDCFYVFYVNEPEGTCRKKCDEGELSWLHPHELLKAKKGYKNTKDIISYFEDPNFDQGKLHFVSKSYPKEY